MNSHVSEAATPVMTVEEVTELETLVRCRLSGQIRDFHIVVTNGGIILRGYTRTYYAKQFVQLALIEQIAVPIVANEIEVL